MTNLLASPLNLPCGVSIPNKLGKSAMTEGLADANDNPTEALIKLYRTWSDGGSGLLMTGNVMVDRRYLERAGNVVLEDDQAMPMLRRWAAEGTHGGNQLWMQISHPGRQCPRLARRIIRSVREAVGPGFPVSAKLNSADFQKGGFSFDDCITVAGWLAEDGLDLLEISGGTYEQASS